MPPAPQPTRQDTWSISCTVDGRDLGIFDSTGGGELDSEEAKYKPGGMGPEISLGGSQTIGNLTIGRYMDRGRDWPLVTWLIGRRGAGRATVGITPLNPQGVVGGSPLTYTGTLKQVTPPEVDSTGNDTSKLELEITCDGV